MATVTKTYTPANILQGPVNIYANITAPASSLTPTADANTLTLDASGQPTSGTGVHLGSIDGPTNIAITEKSNEIMDDQHESPIDVAFDTVEAEIDFTVKELNLSRLQTLLSTLSLTAYNALANSQALQIGGQFSSAMDAVSLLLVSPRRDASGKFLYVMAYKAYLMSAVPTTLHRAKENVWKLKFRCVMDMTRVQGDELMQIVRTK